ncbi:MAG: hypothetical protein IIY21_04420 [Clostridiales bacterium]|nr:hypothetical protein [Clostridiales bacterium]MBQ1573869.1 hypothetical protein [Clostridiales bacterium]
MGSRAEYGMSYEGGTVISPWIAFSDCLSKSSLTGDEQDVKTVDALKSAFLTATRKALKRKDFTIFYVEGSYFGDMIDPMKENDPLVLWAYLHDKIPIMWYHYMNGPRWHFVYTMLNRIFSLIKEEQQ